MTPILLNLLLLSNKVLRSLFSSYCVSDVFTTWGKNYKVLTLISIYYKVYDTGRSCYIHHTYFDVAPFFDVSIWQNIADFKDIFPF